jgi:hypothetical protein
MRFMYHILRLLGIFIIVYFDNILVYSRTLKSYLKHLRAIFDATRNKRLYGNHKKCKFFISIVTFLGFIVYIDGV